MCITPQYVSAYSIIGREYQKPSLLKTIVTPFTRCLPSAFALWSNTRQFGCLLTRLVTKTTATITPADGEAIMKFMQQKKGRVVGEGGRGGGGGGGGGVLTIWGSCEGKSCYLLGKGSHKIESQMSTLHMEATTGHSLMTCTADCSLGQSVYAEHTNYIYAE